MVAMNDPLQIAQAEVTNLIKRHTSPANTLANAPVRLYHYTDAYGLKGILETGILHGTDLRFMNDSGELQYARNVIQNLMPTALSTCRDSLRPAFEAGGQQIGSSVDRGSLQFYAACFCGERDLLSQWKSYANGGEGYAIGFDTQKLASILDLTRHAGESPRAFNEIDYRVSSQEARVRLILDETIAFANRLSLEHSGHPNLPQAIFSLAFGAMATLVSGLARMKDELFRDEREWRIV